MRKYRIAELYAGTARSVEPFRSWRRAELALLADASAYARENVPGVAASPQFSYLTRLLEDADYRWASTIANSAQYGSCQTRQRLLFVALRKDVGIQPKFPRPIFGGDERLFSYSKLTYVRPSDDPVGMLGVTPAAQRLAASLSQDFSEKLGAKPMKTVGETLEALPRMGTRNALDLHHVEWSHTSELLRRMDRVAEGHQWRGGADHFAHSYGRLHRRGLARTITTFFPYAGSGRYWHPTANRSLTIREAARIQGFPDGFKFAAASKRTAGHHHPDYQVAASEAMGGPARQKRDRYLATKREHG
jgi:DNA (cytosine-5)-methyltransferase 1